MDGLDWPLVIEAEASKLPPEEEVIGVEVGNRARAYRLAAFHDRTRHVVNDLVGRYPVTITYCNQTDCLRAYSDVPGPDPLDVSVVGYYSGQGMVLEVEGIRFFQGSGTRMEPGVGPAAIPFRQIFPTRTTWGDWRRVHPETDLYDGLSRGSRVKPVNGVGLERGT